MEKSLHLFFLLFFLFLNSQLSAQAVFYHPDTIREIHIHFAQSNWDELLDELYVAGQQERLLANMVIDGITLDSVGIRYKGFSSVSTDRAKNPFNIALDFVKGNQTYDGIDKIKLSNVIQDPSFLRETLAYEIARKYMPASRANYARVYINDEYWGLYTNVEAVNKDFLAQHFGSRDNPFFKCNPEELDLSGDDNSNLSNKHGTDTTAYYPFYDMRSDEGWTDLYELISILNENPEQIETVLNVDQTLWMHAFNYAIINFDSYVGFAQNYYLYKDNNHRFNPILWDLNQSFASYRLTDASEHFDGFNIEEAKVIDPLLHHSSVSVYPRPLMRNLFANDTYRRMYLAHLRTIMEENFANGVYLSWLENMQALIENSVLEDTNKFYSNEDFYDNLNETVTDLVDYPGLTDLMEARTTYLQNYPGYQDAPDISNVASSPSLFSIGETIWITAEITDASDVVLAYRFGGNGFFQKINMLDDGSQNDGAANDGLYGVQLHNVGNSIQYYIYAENETAGRFSPERAAFEYHVIQSEGISGGDLVINEFMAINDNTQADEAGEYDDWIELHNTTNFDISTAGLYLTDDPENLKKWAMPDALVPAGGYLIVWADSDEEQGALHAGFKLSGDGETLVLTDENETILDEVTFGGQTADISTGRFPNGTGPFVEMPPTFNAINSLTSSVKHIENPNFTVFPNPFEDIFYIKFENEKPIQIDILRMDGKILFTQKVNKNEALKRVHVKDWASGIYFLSIQFYDKTDKVLIAKF